MVTLVLVMPALAEVPLAVMLVPAVQQATLAQQAVLAVHLWPSVTAAQVELAALAVTAAAVLH